jgi:hypothetical protein
LVVQTPFNPRPGAYNEPWEHCCKLTGWCLELVDRMAEGVLLVLGQDAAHFLAQEEVGVAQLTHVVVLAVSTAKRMQEFMGVM